MPYKGNIPWNKGVKGLQVAWNKGKKIGKRNDGSFKKGIIPWNKGLKLTEEQKSKINMSGLEKGRGWNHNLEGHSEKYKHCGFQKGHKSFVNLEGENHPNWKGGIAWYYNIHSWMNRVYGKPNKCDHCYRNDKKRYEWANKDHKYSKNREDWMRLCVSCHRRYDKIMRDENNFIS